ncbi:MAG: single-stranded-DNA-specific exonuclease RecJ [Acidobacteriota bacterium]
MNRWALREQPADQVEQLAGELSCSPLLARLLLARNLGNPDDARRFLSPRLDELHPPWQMADMQRSVDRILRAIELKESILIYGDYDVDGVTSVVILKKMIAMLGGQASSFIPRRFVEGYGLHEERLKEFATAGYRLVISVDSGIRAFSVCLLAARLGIDLIVTDHHLPDRQLPEAYAILNPRRPDCGYPEKELAGVGVTFKLVQALLERSGKSHLIPSFLKIVAIGTIADIVPLRGENRILVAHGLRGLKTPVNIGLKALIEATGLAGKDLCFEDVGFRIGPRINALGRLGDSREAVELFETNDMAQARALVEHMNQQNLQRQGHEAEMLEKIEAEFGARLRSGVDPVIVVSGPSWHAGVVGIVASRLVDRYYHPALVIAVEGERAQGSGRSIPGLHLLEALESCGALFEKFGGHAQAVGFHLPSSQIDALRAGLAEHAGSRLTPELLCREIAIDGVVGPDEISPGLLEDIAQLAPFGHGNPVPRLMASGVRSLGEPRVLKDKHLKFKVGSPRKNFDAIWWRRASQKEGLDFSRPFDVVYTLVESEYRGLRSIQWNVVDIRQSCVN